MTALNLQLAEDLALPVSAVTETFAILARKGSGKTYTAMKLTEQLTLAGQPVVAVDPTGVWWGLRSDAAGTGPGLAVIILGGEHGDVPLEPAAGRLVADLIVDHPGSYVLDLSDFDSNAEQDLFGRDFAERLYRRKARERSPLHVVVDEADAFAPQSPMPDQRRMLGAFQTLMRRGRSRGIGMTVVTQRPAVLHKDMTTQAEVLVAMQLTGTQDRKAVDAWVAANGTSAQRGALMDSLASLQRGEAWVWSPAWLKLFARTTIARRQTFDSSRTPEVGELVSEPRRRAEIPLEELRAAITASTATADGAESSGTLKARIAALERELADSRARVERIPVVGADELERLDHAERTVRDAERQLRDAVGALQDAIGIARTFEVTDSLEPSPATVSSLAQAESVDAPPPSAAAGRTGDEETPRLTRGEREMLVVLAQRHPEPLTAAQLGTLAGVSSRKSTFRNYRARLKNAGLVTDDGADRLQLTTVGLALIGDEVPPRPQGTHELVAMWKDRLTAGERRLLDELVAVFPHPLDIEDLGRRADIDPTKSTMRNYRARLRHMGLVQTEGQRLRASPTLFPDAPQATVPPRARRVRGARRQRSPVAR